MIRAYGRRQGRAPQPLYDQPDPDRQLPCRDGLGALTMRSLAGELGVVPMALYKHVTDRDDLIGGVIDFVIAEYDAPAFGLPWRDAATRNPQGACDDQSEFEFTLDLPLDAFERLHEAGWVSRVAG